MSGVSFESSGNPEEDRRTADRIASTEARLEDGICPNGCALLERVHENEVVCKVCEFVFVGDYLLPDER
jgi:hypothetical protein